MGKGMGALAEFPEHAKFLLICINRTYEKWGVSIAVRYSWKVAPERAEQAEYVVAVFRGTIVGVFRADKWLPATKANFPDIPDEYGNWKKQADRFGFRGSEAPNDIKAQYMGKAIPSKWGFKGNPIRYINF
jgi:hypothetical protein